MAIPLYDASVLNYLQILNAMTSVLEKGLTHFGANNIDPEDVVETRLIADMLPFRFQIHSVAHHSLGAIEGMKSGVFRPPGQRPPHNYRELQTLVAETRDALEEMTPREVNALEGKDMVFEVRDTRRAFSAEGFLLSFSLPNFYFHAATAYDILRSKGVPIGKRDFMGTLRLKN